MKSTAGADLRAALVANCFLGAFPPVDLRAVCLVRAILDQNLSFWEEKQPPSKPQDLKILTLKTEHSHTIDSCPVYIRVSRYLVPILKVALIRHY
jgi:hypothetical protein